MRNLLLWNSATTVVHSNAHSNRTMAAQAVRDLKSAHDELTNYLREADFASDYASLLLAAPSPSLRSDATKWAAAAARASLWRPAVRGVSTQIEKELAAAHERARRWLEQVHVCLATVHLSSAVADALPPPAADEPAHVRAARAMSESLPGWLLALARILLAALEQYVALEGPLPPPPPAAIADQDTVAAALRTVGEGGRLASLRRMTLLQLHATADALESRYPTQAPATIADAAWLGRTLMLNRGRGGERPVPLLGPARMSVGRAWDVATSGLYATLRDGEADSSGSPAFNAEVAQAAADWQGEVEGAGAGSLASAAARDRAVAEAVLAVLQWASVLT